MSNLQPFITRPLPNGRNMYGRPVWEPPVLSYTSLIGEEYQAKRKAYLKYTVNDVAKTTFMMDVFTEYNLLGDYCRWTDSSARFARKEGDKEAAGFWEDMNEELLMDYEEVITERVKLRVREYRYPDGRWEIVESERARGGVDVPWRDSIKLPEEDKKRDEMVTVGISKETFNNPSLELEDLECKRAEGVVTEKKLTGQENEEQRSGEEIEYPPSHDLFTLWS